MTKETDAKLLGSTKLILNQSTMMAAVQMYLDAAMHTAPKVEGIKQVGNTDAYTFEIRLKAEESKP